LRKDGWISCFISLPFFSFIHILKIFTEKSSLIFDFAVWSQVLRGEETSFILTIIWRKEKFSVGKWGWQIKLFFCSCGQIRIITLAFFFLFFSLNVLRESSVTVHKKEKARRSEIQLWGSDTKGANTVLTACFRLF
jgi:hypothetical protein